MTRTGIGLSPNMVEVARREFPHLIFRAGSMESLSAADVRVHRAAVG
ncbi:hypothetical protein O4220_27085 [Rhodococcus ruber]|uniref:Uncharacterized protein n=1 Tax=Rhodococcus ruber TaxID=1830 RepID=A0ABT4MMI7_9NOCA|nr:hypothetical protein [Rhodococcus ruber]MCZ4522204.1 hypothetical protein [Rhodococcus ruber]